MPLVLDKSSIGFTADSDMVEVTAYMTDIQYLSLLTLDEYAAFIPVTVDLDKVTYLDHESREYIASISEEKRMELRAQAVNKLRLEEQFIWEAFWNETDYSDKLEITPVDWFIVDAKDESAPMIGCKAEIRWTGEKKVNYVQDTALTGNDFSSLIGDGNSTAEAGTKSVYDESLEVQEFLREMYLSGGLTQDHSPYDLSVFDDEKATEGSANGGFNLMGSSEGTTNETIPVPEENKEEDPSKDPGEDETLPENAGEDETLPEDKTDTQNSDSQDGAKTEGAEETLPGNGNEPETEKGKDRNDEETEKGETISAEGETDVDNNTDGAAVIEENKVPLAPEPSTEEDDESGDEKAPAEEEDQEDKIDLDSAIFSVRMKANESIVTAGAAYFIPSTQTIPNTPNDNKNDQDPEKPKDPEGPENPEEGENDGEELPDGETPKGTLTEEELAELTAIALEIGLTENELNELIERAETEGLAFEAVRDMLNELGTKDDQLDLDEEPVTPAVLGEPVYYIQMYVGEQKTLTANDFHFPSAASGIFHGGVVNTRLATVEEGSNGTVTLTAEKEGRTKIYAWDNSDSRQFRILVLEILGYYTQSTTDTTPPRQKSAVPMVSTFSGHTLALKANGTVSGWGESGGGQLGNQYVALPYQNSPVDIYLNGNNDPLDHIVMVATGDRHSLALRDDGTVYAWGANRNGQVGSGTTAEATVYYPIKVVGPDGTGELDNIVAIASGANHSLALTADGEVYAWGSNIYGQLGNGENSESADNDATSVPQKVLAPNMLTYLTGIVQIAAGGNFSLALAADGTVYTWGNNQGSQLGNGQNGSSMPFSNVPTMVQGTNEMTNRGRQYDAVEIAAGGQALSTEGTTTTQVQDHAMLLTVGMNDQTSLYGWGRNSHGELGVTTSEGSESANPIEVQWGVQQVTNVVSISAGADHTAAVTADGRAYTWGYNISHQLGHGGRVDATNLGNVPLPTEVYGLQQNPDSAGPDATIKEAYGTVAGVAAALNYTLFWFEDGTVRGVGHGDNGHLGDSTAGLKPLPVLAGDSYSESLVFNKVWVYTKEIDPDTEEVIDITLTDRYASIPGSYTGDNDDAAIRLLEEKRLPETLTITNQQYIVIYKEGIGQYYDVGFNISEESRSTHYEGDSETPWIDYSSSDIGVVSCTDLEVNDAQLDPAGTLGVASTITARDQIQPNRYQGSFDVIVRDSNNFTEPLLFAGDGFMVAVRSDGTVWTWGDNTYGQLGIGKTDKEVPYTTFPVQVIRSADSNKYLSNIVEVAVGANHVLARNSNGETFSWGCNESGQLGLGDTQNRTAPEKMKAGASGLSGVASLAGATSIAAGDFHSLVVVNNTAYSCGGNRYGQLGDDTASDTKVTTLLTGVVSGRNDKLFLSGVEKIFGHANQSFALLNDGTVYSWGANDSGQLGREIEDTGYYYTPGQVSNVDGSFLTNAVDVAPGRYHTLLLMSDNTVRVMGSNQYGQLGYAFNTSDLLRPIIPYGATGRNGVAGAAPLFEDSTNPEGAGADSQQISNALVIRAGDYHSIVIRGTREEVSEEEAERGEVGDIIASEAYVFGRNNYGQLGVKAGTVFTNALGVQTTTTAAGSNNYHKVNLDTDEPILTATGGSSFTGVVTLDGRVYAFGGNGMGQLGEMSDLDRDQADSNLGFLPETGANGAMQMQLTDEASGELVAQRLRLNIGESVAFETVAERTVLEFLLQKASDVTYDYDCSQIELTSTDERIVTVSGQRLTARGTGITTVRVYNQATENSMLLRVEVVDQEEGTDLVAAPTLDSGDAFSVVLKANGTVWAWGDNSLGQIGAGDKSTSGSPEWVSKVDGRHLEDIISVAAGRDHALALAADGTVYAWGSDLHGQLGQGTTGGYQNTAVEVPGLPEDGLAVYAGDGYSMLLTESGEVWSWGNNEYGQLGIGYTGKEQTATYQGNTYTTVYLSYEKYLAALETLGEDQIAGRVPDDFVPAYGSDVATPAHVYQGRSASRKAHLSNIVALATGDSHVLALRADGTVLGWGNNEYGQLGVGYDPDYNNEEVQITFNYHVPVEVMTGTDRTPLNCAVDIAAGKNHSMALMADGTVCTWGSNGYGQLGGSIHGDRIYNPVPRYEEIDGSPVEIVEEYPDPWDEQQVFPKVISVTEEGTKIYGVYAGADVSAAIAGEKRYVYLWGTNANEQLGRKDQDVEHTLAYSDVPTRLNKGESLTDASDGQEAPYFEGALSVALSNTNGAVVKSDFYVWNWGLNAQGQLGNGSRRTSEEPVQVGDQASKTLQLTKYWLYGPGGQKGYYGYQANVAEGREAAPARQDLAEDEYLELILSDDMAEMSIANKDLNGFNLHSDGRTLVTKKENFTVVIADQEILGYTTTVQKTGSILVTLEPKGKLGETTVAILYDDETKGEANSLVFPVVVRHVEKESGSGSGSGSGGGSSSSSDHPAVSAIPKVSSGKSHTVALTTMGEIYTWGDNSFGQLGIGGSYRKTTTYAPDDTTGAVPTYLRPVTYVQGPVRVGANLLYDDGEKVTFTDVAAGENFTLALDSRGRVWSWGDNAYWSWLVQTKNPFGAATDESGELPALHYHGEPVKDSGRALTGKLGRTSANSSDDWVDPLPGLVMAGKDEVLGEGTISIISEEGQTLNDQPDPIISIAAGKDFAMALSRSGRVYTWGLDSYGQLGQGEEFEASNLSYAQAVVKGSSPSSIGSEMSDVVAIAAGSETAYAIRSNGDLWAWGSNSMTYVDEAGVEQRVVSGQLGAGIQDQPGHEPSECGSGRIYEPGRECRCGRRSRRCVAFRFQGGE